MARVQRVRRVRMGATGAMGAKAAPVHRSHRLHPSHRRTRCTHRTRRTRCTHRTRRTRCTHRTCRTRCTHRTRRTTVAPVDPLDRVIDLGEPRDLEVDPPAFTTNEEPQSPPRPLNRPWSTQPSQELDAADAAEPETGRRKWPIAVAVLAVAIIAALSVGWFLRWRAAGSVTETPTGVDATIVDLPGSAPAAPGAGAGKPAPVAPVAPVAPGTRAPAPTPSRPASGAVERAPTGSMLIRSTPADADVLVNGKPRGKTPVALRELALGSYNIRVAREGYAAEERTLQLTRSARRRR